MSDEERIEQLELEVKVLRDNNKGLKDKIDEQSKEIEHQKEKRENQKKELAILNAKQIEFNKLVNTVNSYKGQFKRQQKEIEELKEKNNKLMEELDLTTVYISGVYDGEKKVQDKMKAKIEELEIEQESNREDLKIAIDNLLFQNIDKIGNRISINMSVREILQSLLEKE